MLAEKFNRFFETHSAARGSSPVSPTISRVHAAPEMWAITGPPESDNTIMSHYEYFKRRIRHSGFTRLFLEMLDKIGVRIRGFILYREFDHPAEPLDSGPELENAEMRFLGADDVELLAPFSRHPGRDIPQSAMHDRLKAGNQCMALFLGGELASFTWCDLDACTFPGYPFKLKKNEAYLFDAYTPIAFRGKGLVLKIRQRMYRELSRQGRDVLYSFSDRLNRPANRFKQKLRAKRIVTGYYVAFFSRWQFSFSLKKLDASAPDRTPL